MKNKRKNFPRRELNPGPLTCNVVTLSIAPLHQLLNLHVKLILFNVFAYEILRVDAVWSWQSCIYQEFKDIRIQGK